MAKTSAAHHKTAHHQSRTETELELAREVHALSDEVRKLKDLEFIKILANPWKFLGFSLLKGLMVGLGTVLGATVLVAVLVYLLAQISFVPIVGDFVEDIMDEIKTTKSTEQSSDDTDIFNQYEETKASLNN